MFRRSDLNDVFMAVENVVGMNAGNETFPWEIEAIIPFDDVANDPGTAYARSYYVVVQQFTGITVSGHPFLPVRVDIFNTSPNRHSGTLVTGSAGTTYDAALSNVATLIATDSPELKSGPGPLAGFAG